MTLWPFSRTKTEDTLREGVAALKLALEQLATRPAPPAPDVRGDVALQLEALRAEVDWCKLEIRKVRGKVTGGERKTAEDAPEPAIPAAPPPYLSPQWFAEQRRKLGLPGGNGGGR